MSERLSAIRPYHRIYVAGHNGMVGSAIARALRARGYANLVTRSRDELDLTQQDAVRRFFEETRLDRTRQRLKLIRLDRFKKRLLDARRLEHLLQSQVLSFSRSAKLGTDIRHEISDS